MYTTDLKCSHIYNCSANVVGEIQSFQKESMCLRILDKFFTCRICNENSQFCRNVANVTTLLDFHCVEQLGKRCFVFGKLCFPHSRLSIWKPQRMGRSVVPSAPEHQLSGTLQRAVLNLILLFFLLKCNLMKRCIMTILDVLIK